MGTTHASHQNQFPFETTFLGKLHPATDQHHNLIAPLTILNDFKLFPLSAQLYRRPAPAKDNLSSVK